MRVWPGDLDAGRRAGLICFSGSSWPLWPAAVARFGVQLERPQPRSGEDERAGRRRAAADPGKPGRELQGW